MSDKKYYVPSLEEFHVGFEYEITNGYDWVKKSFTHEDFNSFLYKHLDNAITQEQVRVKFLDREDVESLGWVFLGTKEGHRNGYNIHRYHFLEINKLYAEIKTEYEPYSHRKFRGKIKNVSELRKVMEMVGIKTKQG